MFLQRPRNLRNLRMKAGTFLISRILPFVIPRSLRALKPQLRLPHTSAYLRQLRDAAMGIYSNPIADFFAAYPTFSYNSAKSSAFEFDRLCKHMRWERENPAQKTAWKDFQAAVATAFNRAHGTDANSLNAWQRLCRRLKIKPVPSTLEGAREAVFNTHVNLLDLAEADVYPSRTLRIFPTEASLAMYTTVNHKVVSSSSPMAGGILRALLRRIFHPPPDDLVRDQFGKYVGVARRNNGKGKGKDNLKKAGRRKKRPAAA